MKKRSFNDNWVYHSGGGSAIESLLGIEQQKMVTLPHDAAVEMPRDPSALGGSGNGFFQEKNCYYTKNYAAVRYEPDGVQYPNRVIVGSETYPPDLDKNWELVERLPHVIGDIPRRWVSDKNGTYYSGRNSNWRMEGIPCMK